MARVPGNTRNRRCVEYHLTLPWRLSMDTARKQTPAPRREDDAQHRAETLVSRILRDAERSPEQYARDAEVPKGGE